jgi:hypothetical protein
MADRFPGSRQRFRHIAGRVAGEPIALAEQSPHLRPAHQALFLPGKTD